MNYNQVLEFMFNSLPMYQRIGQAAYKANLNNTLALDEYFNHPHNNFKTIHVAGTNGKGSVSHSIASILQEAGYKTGLYTSPHLVDFRERIKVDGKMISEEYICDFINNNLDIIRELEPSFFEMTVALAFEYFKFSEVDIAVIEVGMGGRLDSTNIINPEISVITNIGFDHIQFLGDTLTKIAGEKGGIIKPNTPVVIGETQSETKIVFQEIARRNNSPIFFADDNYSAELTNNNEFIITDINNFHYKLNFELSGKYQEKNIPTILTAIDKLIEKKYNIKKEHIEKGLANVIKNTGLYGRWEIINTEPLIICDTGHNKEGLTYVINQILSQKYSKLHIILGFVNDKNVSSVIELFPKDAIYYFTQASIPRAMPANELQEEFKKKNISGEIYENVISAYDAALSKANKNDLIFIGGSTFVVADLLTEISKNQSNSSI